MNILPHVIFNPPSSLQRALQSAGADVVGLCSRGVFQEYIASSCQQALSIVLPDYLCRDHTFKSSQVVGPYTMPNRSVQDFHRYPPSARNLSVVLPHFTRRWRFQIFES